MTNFKNIDFRLIISRDFLLLLDELCLKEKYNMNNTDIEYLYNL